MKKIFHALFSLVAVFLFSTCKKDDTSPNPYGSNNGQYMFWSRSDLGVGNIDVLVDSKPAGTISQFYANGVDCGKAEVNIIKQVGTYNWSARAQNGATWSGSISVESGKCNQQELTGGPGTGTAMGCNYSLNGIWTRQNDGTCTGCTGMKVSFYNGQGTILSVPSNSNGFYAGQVKWKNFNTSACKLDELFMPSATYSLTNVSFANANTVAIGSITYIK